MMEYSVPYGRGKQDFQLPEDWQVSVLKPRSRKALDKPAQEIRRVLGLLKDKHRAKGGSAKAAIAINDKTRPVPHRILLPPLLKWLETSGYRRENITLIIAVGTHTPMPIEEHRLIVPEEIAREFRIISHDSKDAENLVDLGMTSAGTPCKVNRIYAEADLRIVTGNIEPHQYMGWSGGVKSAVIGLGGEESIRKNHGMLTKEGAGPCRYEDNPVRMDVEESGGLIGIHLALNVVMNDEKEIVAVFAGNPVCVMEEGIREAKALFSVPFTAPFNVVITAPGGYPKDINLYQAQKALRHAATAALPGAPMILAGACSEGIGHRLYESWMKNKTSFSEVRKAFSLEDFRLGPHKAMLFAGDCEGRDVYLVSNLPEETVKKMLLIPSSSIQDALGKIREKWTAQKRSAELPVKAAILPYGNATVPYPEN